MSLSIDDIRKSVRASPIGQLSSTEDPTVRCHVVCTHEGTPLVTPIIHSQTVLSRGQPARLRFESDARTVELHGRLGDGNIHRDRVARFVSVLPQTNIGSLSVASVVVSRRHVTTEITDVDWCLRPPQWSEREDYVIDHMNSDHRAEMSAMCAYYFGINDSAPSMLGADPEGLHLLTRLGRRYFPFERRCETLDALTKETVRIALLAMKDREKSVDC
ncbi:MAG: DUF2470 domain-containing protein [Pseudomonadota bacterium]